MHVSLFNWYSCTNALNNGSFKSCLSIVNSESAILKSLKNSRLLAILAKLCQSWSEQDLFWVLPSQFLCSVYTSKKENGWLGMNIAVWTGNIMQGGYLVNHLAGLNCIAVFFPLFIWRPSIPCYSILCLPPVQNCLEVVSLRKGLEATFNNGFVSVAFWKKPNTKQLK